MRVVLDANIYISSLISNKGNPAKIVRWWLEGEYDVLVSQQIIDEILRVMGYARIQKKYSEVREKSQEFAALVSEQAEWVEQRGKLDVVTVDESDNRYIEGALTGNAKYIISGDEHLLDFREYEGITILAPAAFAALYQAAHAWRFSGYLTVSNPLWSRSNRSRR